MKKLLTVLLLALLSSAFCAQAGGWVQKKHMFYLGFKGGANLSLMSQPDECDLYDDMGLGYHGGIAFQARLGRASENSAPGTGLFGLGFEARYKLNSVKTVATDESGNANANLDLTYVDVPVFLRLYPLCKAGTMTNFYIEAGPDFAYLLDRKPQSLTAVSPLGANVTYHLDDNKSTLKGMDLRVMAGVGYDFAIKNDNYEATNLIGINARYYMGMSKLAGNFNSKMSSIEVSLSWMFNVGKL